MRKPNLKTKPFVIPASGSVKVGIGGNFIKCLTSTGTDGDILLSFEGGATTKFDVLDKYKFEQNDSFSSFTLENQTAGAITMQIIVGFGDVDTGGEVSVSGNVTTLETAANGVGTVADVALNNGAQTLILAADATRTVAIIVADPANTVNIRLGDNGNVGAARGAMLQIGQAYEYKSTAALYAYAGAAAQSVSITYETRT